MSAPLLLALWVSTRARPSAATDAGDATPGSPWVDGRWSAAFAPSAGPTRATAAPRHRRAVPGTSGAAAGATG